MNRWSQNRSSTWKGTVAIMITIVLWASAFVGIRAALDDYSPTHLALLRYVVASIVLAVYGAIKRIRLPEKEDVVPLLLLGGLGIAFYNIALNYGEQTVSAGAASFLVNTVPIFTALLAFFFLKERINGWGWLGIVAGFLGASIIAIGEATEEGFYFEWGAVMILMAAFAQAIYFAMQKSLLSKYSPFTLTTYAIWFGTLVMIPFQNGLYQTIAEAPQTSTIAVLYLGIFPGALGYVAYAVALSHMQAVQATNFLYLVPAVTLPIAWVWLGETPGFIALAGGALALAGVILMAKKGKRVKETALK